MNAEEMRRALARVMSGLEVEKNAVDTTWAQLCLLREVRDAVTAQIDRIVDRGVVNEG
jgi:hypothetical protein